VVVVGGILIIIYGLRALPAWLLAQGDAGWLADAAEPLAAAATVVRLIVEVVLWPVLGFALLLGPIVIVEDCTPTQAVSQWTTLVRGHLTRAFLYEALAAAVGMVASLPFVVPVELVALTAPTSGVAGVAAQATVWLLRGLALTPLIAFLAVANVFIYLILRYEHTPWR
jgi:hypothetical protein